MNRTASPNKEKYHRGFNAQYRSVPLIDEEFPAHMLLFDTEAVKNPLAHSKHFMVVTSIYLPRGHKIIFRAAMHTSVSVLLLEVKAL